MDRADSPSARAAAANASPRPSVAAPRPASALAVAPPLESRVGLAWLNRIGVVTLFLGVAFAFKTAVDNNWIGPAARVGLGVAGALGTLLLGDRLWKRDQIIFAQGLTGLGLALLYVSFWASFSLYHLLPQPIAFVLMAATTIGSALLAMRYQTQAIAILAMLGGYLTPIVLATGEPQALIFFAYTAALNAGGITLARRRRWQLLEYFAAAGTIALYTGWLAASATPADRPIATVFALVFYVQFAISRSMVVWCVGQVLAPIAVAAVWEQPVPSLPVFLALAVGGLVVTERRRWPALWSICAFWGGYAIVAFDAALFTDSASLWSPASATQPELQLALVSAAFALFTAWFVWWTVRKQRPVGASELAILLVNPAAYLVTACYLLEPHHHAYLGAFVLGLAVVQGGLAKLVWNVRPTIRYPAIFALANAAALVTLAIPIQLTGSSVTIGWAIESACLAWLSARYNSLMARIGSGVVIGFALMRLLAIELDVPPAATLVNARFLTCVVVAASLFSSARWFRKQALAPFAYIAGHAILLLGLGLEIAGYFPGRYEGTERVQAISVGISILLAVYAVVLVVLGVVRRKALDRILGLGLLGVVVAKLYLSDVWELGRAFRIVAFLALGGLLLLVSYLYSRFRSKIGLLWKDR